MSALLGGLAGFMTSGFGEPITRPFTTTANMAMPTVVADLSQAHEWYVTGLTEESVFRLQCRSNGWFVAENIDQDLRYIGVGDGQFRLNVEAWNNATGQDRCEVIANTWAPTIPEAMVMRNRDLIDHNLFRHYLQRNKVFRLEERQLVEQLRFEIPPVQDLIRFSVREAFSPTLVEKFGYQNEFPSAVAYWANKQGLGGDTGVKRPPGVDGDNKPLPRGNATWSELYWWAHWDLPSNTQGYEMLHRLYPTSDYGPSPDITDNASFTSTDLELLQKANDIPTFWRKRLQSISYLPYTRVDTRRMHELGVIGDSEVYHAYRASGYNDTRAKTMLQFSKVMKAGKRVIKPLQIREKFVCSLLQLGLLTTQEAREEYNKAGYNIDESLALTEQCETDFLIKHIKEAIGLIRRALFMGIYTPDEAEQRLRELSVDPDRAKQFVKIWKLRLMVRIKEIAVEKAIKWFKARIISEDELTARMQKLGYRPTDITLTITDAKRELEANKAKDMERQRLSELKTLEKVRKDDIARTKELAKAEKAKLKGVLKAYTDSNLKAFYKSKVMSADDIKRILSLKGWNRNAITRWVSTYLSEESEETTNGTPPEIEENGESEEV